MTWKLAEQVASVTALVVHSGSKLVAQCFGARVPNFVWDGCAAAVAMVRGDDDSEQVHQLPDIASELSAIQAKLADGDFENVTIEIKVTPRVRVA